MFRLRMHLEIGIAVNTDGSGRYTVAAVAVHPDCVVPARKLCFSAVKCACITSMALRCENVRTGVNAACQRTLETLLYRKLLGDRSEALLVVPAAIKSQTYTIPHKGRRAGWALTAAEEYLLGWERGER